jgi:excisionase family DNA binding protein
MITNSTTPKKELVPPLVKVTEVAKYLSVSRGTVRNLIDSGDLNASKINSGSKERKHVRVTRESLLGFYKKRFGHSLTRALAHPFEP